MKKDMLNKIYYNNKKIHKRLTCIEDYMNDNINCIIPEEKQKEIAKINFYQLKKISDMDNRNKKILITVKIIGIIMIILSSTFGYKLFSSLFGNFFDILSLWF
jgi:hypothetical protein